MKDLDDVLLATIDNDAEGRVISILAAKAGMTVYRSAQRHGATLDDETGFVEYAQAINRPHIWTVEIPGEKTEQRLRSLGFIITGIDHHVYGKLDRAHDATGKRLQSSLEQFLTLTDIQASDLIRWGFDPLLIYGIGIMDDRYVQGLRKAKYTKQEIDRVLDYREELERQIDPYYAERTKAAELAWKNRLVQQGFIVYASNSELSISRLVSTISIRHGVESNPSIIYCRGGKQLFVLNISAAQIEKLNHTFPGRYTWTYGAGHCWGLNNEKSPNDLWVTISIKDLTDLLIQA